MRRIHRTRAPSLGIIGYRGELTTLRVIQFVEVSVFTALHTVDPGSIGAIPIDGCGQAAFEIHQRLPTGFARQLLVGKGIAAIMAGPIGDARDERMRFTSGFEDAMDYFEIGQ